MRAPYQVLVFLYKKVDENFLYGIFKREDLSFWQGIAGGGEEGETLIESAKRETCEESGLKDLDKLFRLASIGTMPTRNIHSLKIENCRVVIPEFSFACEVDKDFNLKISEEHTNFKWLPFKEALQKLNWDSNKTALYELDYILNNNNSLKDIEMNQKNISALTS